MTKPVFFQLLLLFLKMPKPLERFRLLFLPSIFVPSAYNNVVAFCILRRVKPIRGKNQNKNTEKGVTVTTS